MTLALNTLTSNGMILTADSRQTYRNSAGMVRIGSDSTTKIFKVTDMVGVAIAGKAFVPDPNGKLKNVGYFIGSSEEMARQKKSWVESGSGSFPSE